MADGRLSHTIWEMRRSSSPAATLRDNAAVMTVVNILIGMVVGAAVVWFLIAPAVNQTKSSTKNRNVIALSEQIASQKTQIQTA